MKLKFNFDGKTLLRNWWKIVRDNFELVEEEFNSHVSEFEAAKKTLQNNINSEASARKNADTALGNRVDSEASARSSADTALGSRIDSEASARSSGDTALRNRIDSESTARSSADTALGNRINSESSSRKNADNMLQQNINIETAARESADTALEVRVTAVEGKAHTHDNNDLLDAITEEDVEKWNGIKTQVSAKELDEAVRYFEEISFGLETQFELLLNAAGVITYNGGWFDMEQNGTELDGGELGAEPSETIDCGGFEPLCITLGVGAVINGGKY